MMKLTTRLLQVNVDRHCLYFRTGGMPLSTSRGHFKKSMSVAAARACEHGRGRNVPALAAWDIRSEKLGTCAKTIHLPYLHGLQQAIPVGQENRFLSAGGKQGHEDKTYTGLETTIATTCSHISSAFLGCAWLLRFMLLSCYFSFDG